MKIALFSRYPDDSEHPRGGVEAVAVVLAKALARLEVLDVHVVTLEHGRKQTFVEKDGDITVHRLSRSNWPEIVDINFGPSRRRLVRYIMELKPDVLHTHETFGLGLGTINMPHVFTVHGFDHANLIADSAKHAWFRSQLWKLAERKGLATQKHIISINPYVKSMIKPQTSARIHEIDNPVDERFFQIVRKPESGRVLCVGWINERKNTLGSVKAFARIHGRNSEAKLVIAGEASDEEYGKRVELAIKHYALEANVEVRGHIDHNQLEHELARASVFLLPSRQENAPMAIAEAMAAGIPVIASNRCGMPHMVYEEQTGFLIDPESTGQIADRLARLIDSAELCGQMGQAARQAAVKRFHPSFVAEKTWAVYQCICTNQ